MNAAGLLGHLSSSVFLFFCLLCQSSLGGTALYLCLDPTNRQVVTDSPAQLAECELLTNATSAPPTPGGGASTLLEESHSFKAVPDRLLPHDSTTGQIIAPIDRLNHLFIVTLELNHSRQVRLILDTGASHTILSHAVAAELGLYADLVKESITLNTVGGPVQANLVRLRSARIAQAEARNTQAAIYDLPDAPEGVDGLLGLSFLREFEITLDTTHDQLRLRRVANQ